MDSKMLKYSNRARGTVVAIAAAASGLLLSGCDVKQELLAPQQPGVISPSSVTSATAAEALYTGALGAFKTAMNGGGGNTEALWNWQGLFTDELQSSDTFSQRNDADQRNLQTNDAVLTPIYNRVMQARGRARDATHALVAYDNTATGKRDIGEMFFMMGYLELEASQSFCNGVPFGETVNGVPIYTDPLTNAQGFQLAITHFDSALTFLTGTDAGTQNVVYAVKVARARAQVDLADYNGAATTVASVPTSFQYTFDFSASTADNEWWVMGPSVKRYIPGDTLNPVGQRIQNSLPFLSTNDPRVPVVDSKGKAEDNVTEFYQINLYGKDDPTPVLSGIDARLVEAEAKLKAGDIAGTMTILNALRTTSQTLGLFKVPTMTALATPGDAVSARALFFREKAFWQFERGYRMDDLRRLVRQYGQSQDQVFPTGPFARNTTPAGNYGSEVAFPVPDAERTNPKFTGCLDTKA
jgi:starch-binding outer membrane protein, SusD/RagB family